MVNSDPAKVIGDPISLPTRNIILMPNLNISDRKKKRSMLREGVDSWLGVAYGP
jgi:hypothetical protein